MEDWRNTHVRHNHRSSLGENMFETATNNPQMDNRRSYLGEKMFDDATNTPQMDYDYGFGYR